MQAQVVAVAPRWAEELAAVRWAAEEEPRWAEAAALSAEVQAEGEAMLAAVPAAVEVEVVVT